MDSIITWLYMPLAEDGMLRMWMPVAAGILIIAVLLVLHFTKKRKERKKLENVEEDPVTEQPETLPKIEIANLQGLGRREEQQDAFGASLLKDYEKNGLLAVLCDGMGGEAHGGLASRIAVDVISKRILGTFSEMMNRNSVRNLLITAVSAANSSVVDAARKQPEGAVMGTTCVAAIVSGGRAYIVNVGASRGYHLFTSEDSECIQQVTKDHSHVRDLIDRGEITEEQAKLHPDRNKITRAIGAEEMVTPDYFELDLADGDMLLLCSDGLSSYGDDMDILDICFEYPTEEICDKLVDYANGNGGHDNISVALIAV